MQQAEAEARSETPTAEPPPGATTSPAPAPTPTPTAQPGGEVVGLGGTDGGTGTFPNSPGLWERLSRDPVGNALAILVLVGMMGVVGSVAVTFRRAKVAPLPPWKTWAIPLLALVGAAVAGYLAYVETAEVTAVCGPVGDCNTVQQSDYARIFGLLPVGTVGLIGYGAILVAWLVGQLARGTLASAAWLMLFGMALAGTLFSIYLTFLEPFVIGATCAWCLTSAVLITVLLWITTPPGKQAASYFLPITQNQQ
ncbi:MAG: vitamin K epoxide reductase family protein [Chloroflexaceae bacterium]|nr:vitamin K epoxide reductase family protein [Chloroflexaceae bacterium]